VYCQRLIAGGLKLWESSVDLANVLVDRFWSPTADCGGRHHGMRGMRVMELGCGHGLPGIVCALSGAEVCFQVLARAPGADVPRQGI
jgi:predicted nicotinamide N-methyase